MKEDELKDKIKFNLTNKYNCVPIGFKAFVKLYPGIIKGTHTCITGSPGSGKTKFLKHHWIFEAIEFVKQVNNEKELDIKIFVYLLKQSKKAFRAEILSSFLYRDYKIELSYLDLLSIQEEKKRKMNEDILKKIDLYDGWFEYFDSKVELHDQKKKPSEIYDHTRKWIESYAGKFENEGERKVFNYDNPNLFVLCCTDNLRSLASETDKNTGSGMDTRKCIEKHVITNMTTLKTVYDCAICDVHDQNADRERIETDYSGRKNEEKLEPSIDGLGDSKIVGNYYDFILGLHNPNKYGFTDHKGYNVALLGDNYRSVKLINGMFSSPNGYLGNWFNGASGTFEELPPVRELTTQLQIENYINKKRK